MAEKQKKELPWGTIPKSSGEWPEETGTIHQEGPREEDGDTGSFPEKPIKDLTGVLPVITEHSPSPSTGSHSSVTRTKIFKSSLMGIIVKGGTILLALLLCMGILVGKEISSEVKKNSKDTPDTSQTVESVEDGKDNCTIAKSIPAKQSGRDSFTITCGGTKVQVTGTFEDSSGILLVNSLETKGKLGLVALQKDSKDSNKITLTRTDPNRGNCSTTQDLKTGSVLSSACLKKTTEVQE